VDLRGVIGLIRVPVLIISGDRDVALPWTGHGDLLAQAIPAAHVQHLPAAHLSNLEAPRSFTSALLQFLQPERHAARTTSAEAGLQIRRAVLGDAHVDRALASAADSSSDFQDLVVRYPWGAIWARPGLDVRTRRLLVLAMTAAMGRWEEFRLHVKTGLPRELEWCDLEEVLLQAAVYAGVPAANTGFQVAAEERRQTQAAPAVSNPGAPPR
jgi:3-oxoadipate enol-lactonase / 4-carboxymuconolactone decarboxylase